MDEQGNGNQDDVISHASDRIRIPADISAFTLKDLIELYLHELELLQDNIDRLESRLSKDIERNESSIQDVLKLYRRDVCDMRKEVGRIKNDISKLNLNFSNMIHESDSDRKDVDHQHDIEIRQLQWQMGAIGAGSGFLTSILTFILSEPVVNASRDIIIAIIK